jgi:NitT/TauT family transport system permease protein
MSLRSEPEFEGELALPTERTRLALGTLGLVVLLAVWWVGSMVVTPDYLLPAPPAVLDALVVELTTVVPLALPLVGGLNIPLTGQQIATSVPLPRALAKLAQTLFHFVPGVLVGATVGIVAGVGVGYSRTADAIVTPIVRVLRPIPPLAWVVFAIVWFGIGHVGAAFIVAIGALWINFYGAYSGVRGMPDSYAEVASSLGVRTHREMVRLVVVPAALPSILSGFRTSLGRCLMIVVGAELFGAPGVGYEIINASNNLDMARSMAFMLVISATYLCLDTGYERLERRLLVWRP